MTTTSTPHIVVLGAGYTGMLAAIGLARRTGARITLVNPSDRFTERLRLHQQATGQELKQHSIPALLEHTGITFRRGAATALDPDARTVAIDDGTILTYDTLIYALGSRTGTADIPGAREHAVPLDHPDRIAARLATASTVTVCGAGLTGIETAAEIAERHPEIAVTLISRGEPGAMMGTGARAHLNRALDRLGVRRRAATVTGLRSDGVRLDTGELISSDLTIQTTGVQVSPLAADSGIAVDPAGLIRTDPMLRSISHPDIHAVGDAAAIRMAWGDVHGTCQTGLPTAAYTADTVARLLRGRRVEPFRIGYFHQPVSLGRRDAVIQFTRADDTPRRWYLTGRAAVAYKEAVTSSPPFAFRLSRRVPVMVRLTAGGRATRRPAAQEAAAR
ncbi:NAD(P)/FAD-dependent oxidoreductase [Nocardia asteroides]|uniref:NAD(P)/FAD-dependent oxidoreductase n=1 Tax=Nocardia asteroides TaxID=1824 RepID=UPI001E5AEE3F|nr:FAD-dependent oxidoreductase [Nocardia asteroides]UGT60856.1 FAD-dependent oxidoreductase [Nocardia asteroides]